MLIGDRLRELRESKKLSQGDIEKRTGLLRCYISRVENGHTVPAIETLEKLARALEIPLYQLFYDGEEPPKLGRHRMGKQRQARGLFTQAEKVPEQSGRAGPQTHHGHGTENGHGPRSPHLGGSIEKEKRPRPKSTARVYGVSLLWLASWFSVRPLPSSLRSSRVPLERRQRFFSHRFCIVRQYAQGWNPSQATGAD